MLKDHKKFNIFTFSICLTSEGPDRPIAYRGSLIVKSECVSPERPSEHRGSHSVRWETHIGKSREF